jgi:hypothetical protein
MRTARGVRAGPCISHKSHLPYQAQPGPPRTPPSYASTSQPQHQSPCALHCFKFSRHATAAAHIGRPLNTQQDAAARLRGPPLFSAVAVSRAAQHTAGSSGWATSAVPSNGTIKWLPAVVGSSQIDCQAVVRPKRSEGRSPAQTASRAAHQRAPLESATLATAAPDTSVKCNAVEQGTLAPCAFSVSLRDIAQEDLQQAQAHFAPGSARNETPQQIPQNGFFLGGSAPFSDRQLPSCSNAGVQAALAAGKAATNSSNVENSQWQGDTQATVKSRVGAQQPQSKWAFAALRAAVPSALILDTSTQPSGSSCDLVSGQQPANKAAHSASITGSRTSYVRGEAAPRHLAPSDEVLPRVAQKWLRESQRALLKGPVSVARLVELLDRARRLSSMHAVFWRGEPADVLAQLLVSAAKVASGVRDPSPRDPTPRECLEKEEHDAQSSDRVRLLPNSVRLLRAAEGAVKYNRAARAALAATPAASAVAAASRQLLEVAVQDTLRTSLPLERRGRACRVICLAQVTFHLHSARFWQALMLRGVFVPKGEVAYWVTGGTIPDGAVGSSEGNTPPDTLTRRLRFSPPLTILFLHTVTTLKRQGLPADVWTELVVAAGAAASAVRPDTAARTLSAYVCALPLSDAAPPVTPHTIITAACSALPHLSFYKALGVLHDLATIQAPPSRSLECSLLAFVAGVGAPRNSHQWLLILKALRRLGRAAPPEVGRAVAASFSRQLPRPVLSGTADALLACPALGIHLQPYLVHRLTEHGVLAFEERLRTLCWGPAPGGRGWAHSLKFSIRKGDPASRAGQGWQGKNEMALKPQEMPRSRINEAELLKPLCEALGPPFVGLQTVQHVETVAREWVLDGLRSSGSAAAGAALHHLLQAFQRAQGARQDGGLP